MLPGTIGQALAQQVFDTSALNGHDTSATRLRQELLRFVRGLNRAWTLTPDRDKLRSFFHPSLLSPEGRAGKDDSFVATRLALGESGRIAGWKELRPQVRIFGGGRVAVIRYQYELKLETAGRASERRGQDTLVLSFEQGRWWIIADECHSAQEGRVEPHIYDFNSSPLTTPHHGTAAAAASGLTARPRWVESDYSPDLLSTL